METLRNPGRKRLWTRTTFVRGQCEIPSKGRGRPETAKIDSKRYKKEFRAFPLMKSPCNLRKYTQSITKCSSELPLEQEFRKKDDYRNGTIKVPLAWRSSKCLMTLAVRQSGVHRHSQLLVNLQPWQNASQAESEASENFILTGRDFALNILCHLGCANGILGKQYFTVPRNSTVCFSEKRNLVMTLATGPKELEREIIWPAMLATYSAWTRVGCS